MKIKSLICVIFLLIFAVNSFAQQEHWNKFTKQNWQKIDYSKKLLTAAQLKKLSDGEQTEKPDDDDIPISELALLRGVVFGKHGRIFKERSIQDYLEKQKWYKPNENFVNSSLTKRERENLDMIRIEEARRHSYIQPGDMRIWEKKLISEDKLGGYSPAELRILIAEIEAIHGKTFPDEKWLQKYFDERYWYQPNPNYSQSVLNDTERKNIETLYAEKSNGRNTAISIGDMENFQNVALTENELKGLTMMELRMVRNEFWARRGLKFKTPGVRQYFEWRDWYKPLKDQSKVKLGDIEQQNVNLILAQEAKLREKLSTEVLSENSLDQMFTEDLRVLRNEIYARHGRIFKDAELQKYFEAQNWYQPNPEFTDESLTETEYKNLSAIREAETYAVSKFELVEG